MSKKKNPIKKKTKGELELDKIASDELKQHIRILMIENRLTWDIVAKRLAAFGRPITVGALKNKISRGTYDAAWFWDLQKVLKDG